MIENIIYPIQGEMAKTLLFTEDKIWLSGREISSLDKFQKVIEKPGMMDAVESIDINSIYEIIFKENSATLKIKYVNSKGKNKNLVPTFTSEEKAVIIANYLEQKLSLARTVNQENKTKPLLVNMLIIAGILAVSIALGLMEDTSEMDSSTTRKNRLGAEVIKIVYDTIGPTGIILIGIASSLFVGYKALKRYKNPDSEIVLSR